MGIGAKGHTQSGLSGLLLIISTSGVPVPWEDSGMTQEKKGKGETKLNPSIVIS